MFSYDMNVIKAFFSAFLKKTTKNIIERQSFLFSFQLIFKHNMSHISFASGGDSDAGMDDFVAYVAKDKCGVR